MADISKINAVALANIAKLDAVLAANLAKVNGLVFSTAPAIGAPAAAYSVRLLDTAVGVPTYTGSAMRVRRDTGGTGDDDEADIAFDTSITDPTISLDSAISNASAGVTATTLGQFLNVGTVGGTTYTNPDSLTVTASCYVDEWKDQSGNAYHAEQATHGSQPQIHDGTVNTDLIQENGKPALKWTGSEELNYTWPDGAGSTQDFGEDYFWFSVASPTAGGPCPVLFVQGGININTRMGTYYDTNSDLIMVLRVSQVATITSSTTLTAGQKLLGLQGEFTSESDRDFTSYLNTSNVGTVNFTTTYSDNSGVVFWFLRIGAQYTQNFTGTQQEHIMYGTDMVANRTAIEVNVNNHFAIGNFPNPTSGLLATYTGAAAAYSVRQLANTAALSMRVREDATDTETNIGFDANGDLDTAAIAAHCGTANGYVVNWFDQSGEQNDATQSTSGNQPQIYNGTAVITVESGGKPGVFCADSADFLTVTGAVDTTARTIYQWSVHSLDGTGSYPSVKTQQLSDFYYINTEIPRTFVNRATTVTGINAASAINANQAYLRHSYADTTNVRTYLDGSSTAIIDFTDANEDWGSTDFTIFNSVSGSTGRMILSELVFWQSDQDTNRSGIETDINNYFSIY